MRTDRLQALCDGVFAIAMTLLVLELPVPAESGDLAGDVLHEWPSYAAYLVSFVTIGIVWMNHHALMDGVARADRGLLELNLVLLLFVALMPWPTAVAAEYLRDDSQATAAAVIYGLAMAAMAGAFTGLWLHLQRRADLAHPALGRRIDRAVRRSLIGPAAYLAGVAVALAAPLVAFGLYAGVAAFFAVSGRGARLTHPSPAP